MGDFQGPTVYLPEGNIWAIYMITTLVNLWENLWDLTRNLQGTAEMGASQANAADVLRQSQTSMALPSFADAMPGSSSALGPGLPGR